MLEVNICKKCTQEILYIVDAVEERSFEEIRCQTLKTNKLSVTTHTHVIRKAQAFSVIETKNGCSHLVKVLQ